MRKITLLLALVIFFSSCKISQESDLEFIEEDIIEYQPCGFQNREYLVTSYLYDIPVDLNNDQVYSNDIIDQTSCYTPHMDFDSNDGAINMLSQFASARVITDSNGNLIQSSGCVFSDGAKLTCFKNGEEIILTFNNSVIYTGSISDNGNVLTFVIPNETLLGYHLGFHEILTGNGNVINYEGAITIQFELQ